MNFIRSKAHGGAVTVGGAELDVSRKLGQNPGRYEGKELVFGFRPKAVSLGQRETAFVLSAAVELTEMLGDNVNVYIKLGEQQAILKVDPHDAPEIDSKIVFSIPPYVL